jgi:hypothetical protein
MNLSALDSCFGLSLSIAIEILYYKKNSQTLTDFQNETGDTMREIADILLDSQKEVIKSMQEA